MQLFFDIFTILKWERKRIEKLQPILSPLPPSPSLSLTPGCLIVSLHRSWDHETEECNCICVIRNAFSLRMQYDLHIFRASREQLLTTATGRSTCPHIECTRTRDLSSTLHLLHCSNGTKCKISACESGINFFSFYFFARVSSLITHNAFVKKAKKKIGTPVSSVSDKYELTNEITWQLSFNDEMEGRSR